MIVDRQSVRPAESNTAESAALPPPSTAEDLSPFVGMTGCLRKFVDGCMLSMPLTEIHRNKIFDPRRARQARIPWSEQHQHAFFSLKSALTAFPIPAILLWDRSFFLHTDASTEGAGAALTHENEGSERVIALVSHRWSRTYSRRGSTERECMTQF